MVLYIQTKLQVYEGAQPMRFQVLLKFTSKWNYYNSQISKSSLNFFFLNAQHQIMLLLSLDSLE